MARKNRYIVYFGERPIFSEGKIQRLEQVAEICDAFSKGEVRKRMKVKSKQIVFMRPLGY